MKPFFFLKDCANLLKEYSGISKKPFSQTKHIAPANNKNIPTVKEQFINEYPLNPQNKL
jgi:hypothetical protein